MSIFKHRTEKQIDIIQLEGSLDDESIEQLRQKISGLRQQKSTKLLLLGDASGVVRTRRLESLENAIRNYRMVGGTVALAQFHEGQVRWIRETSWSRHINIFQSADEAKAFLSGDNHRKKRKEQLKPTIHEIQLETGEESQNHREVPSDENEHTKGEGKTDSDSLQENLNEQHHH